MDTAVSLKEFVLSAIATVCSCDRTAISPDTPILLLGMDSVRMVSLVSQVEAEFGVQFSTEDVLDFFIAERVADMVGLMIRRLRTA